MDSTTSKRCILQAAQAKPLLCKQLAGASCENGGEMQPDPALGVDPELSRRVDLAEDQVLPAAETRNAVCSCPSADQCEWDRFGRPSHSIRVACRAGARPRYARGG